ncbi:MAG: DUF6702 family protein [Pseudomonadota bacterium]
MHQSVTSKVLLIAAFVFQPVAADAHPLRLSLSEIEYSSEQQLLTISLRLFLMDVNEALVFDPDSTELAFCQPNEAPYAERLLMEYLDRFFHVKIDGEEIALTIKSKQLSGEGINTALAVLFEHRLASRPTSLEVRNAVFTDLFFDQSNVVYVHVDDDSKSLMLNKETPAHQLTF